MVELQEIFTWRNLRLSLDISKAKLIVGAPYAKPDGRVSVNLLFNQGIKVYPAHAMKSDLKSPIILGTIGGNLYSIDGHHRIYKAFMKKVRTLPCYVLTAKETASCAIHYPLRLPDKQRFNEIDRIVDGLGTPAQLIP